MFGCESVAVVFGWEVGFAGWVKGHSQRGHVGLNQYVRRDDFGLELRMGSHQPWVLMTSHVVPRPTIEATFLYGCHVIGNEIVAEGVTFVGGAPQLAGNCVDGFADAVTNSVGVHLDELALGSVLKHIGSMELAGMGVRIVGVRSASNRHEHMFAIGGKDYITRPVAAAAELSVSGEIGHDGLGRVGCLEVA